MRWQLHAAQVREVGSAGEAVGDGKNSPQPSSAWPPKVAAWFLRHSLYANAPPPGGGAWRLLVKKRGLMGWIPGGVSLLASAEGCDGVVVVISIYDCGASKLVMDG